MQYERELIPIFFVLNFLNFDFFTFQFHLGMNTMKKIFLR